nr:N-acetylornithine carbamoyltransferase [Parvularcula mediterranea]
MTTEDWTKQEIEALLEDARALKAAPQSGRLRGKRCALLFFNPSLRTRTSFQVGIADLGGTSVVLDAAGTWPLEVEPGAIMDGEAEEHVAEAARVLSTYVDLIAIRAFPKFEDWSREREDPILAGFVKHATVPIINMETIVHPCQELAMLMALQARHGDLAGKNLTLTWTYHPKPLNTAVANSALLAATKMGMNVTLLCPSAEYMLDEKFMEAGRGLAAAEGASVRVSHDIEDAYRGADAVYAKSWGRLDQIGLPMEERLTSDDLRRFIVDEDKMALTNIATFSHCLPMRRNVKATDAVVDGPNSLIIDEAENRLHVQKAVLSALIGS